MIKKLITKYRGNKISKLKRDVDLIIQYRISILVLAKFSDKKLLEINELSMNLFFHIMNNEELLESLSNMKEEVLEDNLFNKYLSIRYLLLSYLSENIGYEKGIEKYLEEAKIRDSTVVRLNKKSFNILEKDIKKTKKELKKEKQLLIEEKIEKKKKEEIKPIKISTEGINFLLKICSLFFIVGGFLYTYFLLSYFNINVSLYYSISDYIAGSIDVLFNIFVILIVLSIFMIFQFDKMINKKIYNEELNIENKLSDKPEYFVSISLLIVIATSYFITKEINVSLVISFLLIFFTILLPKIRLFDYLENSTFIYLSILGFILFSSQLAFKIDRDIKNVLKDEKIININLKDKYEGFEDLNFITMNSNYIFLWNKKENKSVVLPLSTISNLNSIEIKK
ncbi:MAG: hypothetical protein PHG81_04205 [Aliarcobacter sp.]|nr:hypothetical protein [Aliarcobacter sp.]